MADRCASQSADRSASRLAGGPLAQSIARSACDPAGCPLDRADLAAGRTARSAVIAERTLTPHSGKGSGSAWLGARMCISARPCTGLCVAVCVRACGRQCLCEALCAAVRAVAHACARWRAALCVYVCTCPSTPRFRTSWTERNGLYTHALWSNAGLMRRPAAASAKSNLRRKLTPVCHRQVRVPP